MYQEISIKSSVFANLAKLVFLKQHLDDECNGSHVSSLRIEFQMDLAESAVLLCRSN